MLAAAQFLAVEDVSGAISVLSNNCEHDMAYALAQCFQKDTAPHIIDMADRVASFGSIDLAVEMLVTLTNGEEEIGLMISRYCNATTTEELIAKYTLRPLSAWMHRANEEEQIGSDAESVTSYVIAQSYNRAVKVGIEVLRRLIREPLELSAGTKKLVRALKFVKAEELEEPLRMQFLLIMLWFSAHEAAGLGLWDTACCMLNLLHLSCSLVTTFPLSETDIQYQLMNFKVCAGKKKDAVTMIEKMMREQSLQPSSDNTIPLALRQLSDLLVTHSPVENTFLVSLAFKNRNIVSPMRMAEGGVWGDHTPAIMK